MTAETTERAINSQPFQSTARKNRVIRELAMAKYNDWTHRDIAQRNGLTKQYVSRISMDNRAEIEELEAVAEEKLRELWVMDPYNRALERMTDIEELNEELALHKAAAHAFAQSMGKAGEPVGEQYYKAMDTKHRILKQLEESSGQLPTRAPAVVAESSKMTYEVKGVDVAEVVKSWGQGQQ